MKLKSFYILSAILIGASCQKEEEANSASSAGVPSNIKELTVPTNFGFETTTDVRISATVRGLNDQPLSSKRIEFFTADPDQGGEFLSAGFTNPGGLAEILVQVPAYVPELFIKVNAAGIGGQVSVPVQENITIDFGGKYDQRSFKRSGALSSNPVPISANYYYMGAFATGSNNGLPSYLEPVGDVISQAFLDDVDASLPESRPVPINNPNYLTVGNELDVVVDDKADVWVTFVTEGAGYRNALGYYVFNSNNPPATPSDIDSIHIILPNASLDGENGKLQPGDKVKLGTFEAGNTISWVLFQNAWDGNNVKVNNTKYYSRIDFNNESDPTKKQHTVQLADVGRQLLLNGFEDQNRSAKSDNDFNDLVFYVTANPWENIDISNIPPVTPKEDKDGDGVSDESDDYPNDPQRAVRNDYLGTLAYEDLWPSEGDYDFNDLVVEYSIGHILNSANKLVEIDADWTVRAVGAAFANGFGFQFNDINGSAISSITGQDLQENIVTVNGNGTEQGQSLATVIAFDNVFNIIRNAGGPFINTVPSSPFVPEETVSNLISFNVPQVQAEVGLPPYNPFIFVNGIRGKEVHLKNYAPTDLADVSYFGTSKDASNLGSGVTYTTENGLPSGIHITGRFDYPVEYAPINDAYLLFSNWAVSGGTQYEDWHLDISSNRNTAKIY